jgi:hypothetical protein
VVFGLVYLYITNLGIWLVGAVASPFSMPSLIVRLYVIVWQWRSWDVNISFTQVSRSH